MAHLQKEIDRKEKRDQKRAKLRERKQQARAAKRKGIASGDSVDGVENVEQHNDINQQR
jgi:ribosome assembly protein YihI (activator of Der GTPase)